MYDYIRKSYVNRCERTCSHLSFFLSNIIINLFDKNEQISFFFHVKLIGLVHLLNEARDYDG